MQETLSDRHQLHGLVAQYRQSAAKIRRALKSPDYEWTATEQSILNSMLEDLIWTINHLNRTYLAEDSTTPNTSKYRSDAFAGTYNQFKTQIRVLSHIVLYKRSTSPINALHEIRNHLSPFHFSIMEQVLLGNFDRETHIDQSTLQRIITDLEDLAYKQTQEED